jgi:hypothetical protein
LKRGIFRSAIGISTGKTGIIPVFDRNVAVKNGYIAAGDGNIPVADGNVEVGDGKRERNSVE